MDYDTNQYPNASCRPQTMPGAHCGCPNSMPSYPTQHACAHRPTPARPGCSKPVRPGCSAPVCPGCSAPVCPGCSAPVCPGCSAPVCPRCSAPAHPGYPIPICEGYSEPILPGYSSPVYSECSAPVCPGQVRGPVEQKPLAMAYVPWQQWKQPFSIDKALFRGTIFPELDIPFMRGRC